MNATLWELNIFASRFHELEKAVTKRLLRSVFLSGWQVQERTPEDQSRDLVVFTIGASIISRNASVSLNPRRGLLFLDLLLTPL